MKVDKLDAMTYSSLLSVLENDVMGFLNEVQLNFPEAVSMASGRPDESFFDLEIVPEYISTYVNHVGEQEKCDSRKVLETLGQYNRAKGIINELVANYLETDLNIKASPLDILVNVGTQEGMVLSLLTLCDRTEDIIIVENPTYVGITHFSWINGYKVDKVPMLEDGLCLETLEKKITAYQENGKNVKLVYVIPDFQNPTGTRMSLEKRKSLLVLSQRYGFMIVEDNAYGDFVFEGRPYPTIKSMDNNGQVIYLHSFSKILHPSLRLGIMVADKIYHDNTRLSDLLSKVKGYITVNTPALTQSILGGILIKNQFSLRKYNKKKLRNLKAKRDSVLTALHKNFKSYNENNLASISWNLPKGGYFLTITLPVNITKEDVIDCAKNFKVLFTPSSFFYIEGGGNNQIRLAYSYIKKNQIEHAIKNLSDFIMTKVCAL